MTVIDRAATSRDACSIVSSTRSPSARQLGKSGKCARHPPPGRGTSTTEMLPYVPSIRMEASIDGHVNTCRRSLVLTASQLRTQHSRWSSDRNRNGQHHQRCLAVLWPALWGAQVGHDWSLSFRILRITGELPTLRAAERSANPGAKCDPDHNPNEPSFNQACWRAAPPLRSVVQFVGSQGKLTATMSSKGNSPPVGRARTTQGWT
jgi:hypothetical protein